MSLKYDQKMSYPKLNYLITMNFVERSSENLGRKVNQSNCRSLIMV